ncbi:MAG: VanZ family protein [Planctomycetes bacterium]|nr:VanZ family protein [Planctomycetota bacterium]
MKIILSRWLPFVLYAGLIFYISSGPLPEIPGPLQIEYIDLVAHALEYALFTWLAYRAFGTIKALRKQGLFITLLISILYGFSDELHQYSVPGRQMDTWILYLTHWGRLRWWGY